MNLIRKITITETERKTLIDFKNIIDQLDYEYGDGAYNTYEILECLCEGKDIYGYDLITSK